MTKAPPPTVAELHDPGRYSLAWQIDHDRLVEEVRPHALAPSRLSRLYLAANALAVGVVAWAWSRGGLPPFEAFGNVCLGMMIGYFVLLPVHEELHARVYRRLGADRGQVRVVYQLRRLTAYCVADRFVVDRADMLRLCLAPFVWLNPPLLVLALTFPGRAGLWLAGALLLHVGACWGDFALANWVWRRGRAEAVYNYDDVAGRRSYFFVAKAAGEIL